MNISLNRVHISNHITVLQKVYAYVSMTDITVKKASEMSRFTKQCSHFPHRQHNGTTPWCPPLLNSRRRHDTAKTAGPPPSKSEIVYCH